MEAGTAETQGAKSPEISVQRGLVRWGEIEVSVAEAASKLLRTRAAIATLGLQVGSSRRFLGGGVMGVAQLLTSSDFLINIYAGLVIFVLEIAILVVLLPKLIKRADDKKWAYARLGIRKSIESESEGLQIAIYRIVETKGKDLAEIKGAFDRDRKSVV